MGSEGDKIRERCSFWREHNKSDQTAIDLVNRLEKMAEVLEQYADEKAWEHAATEYGEWCWFTNDDRGSLARKTLAEIAGEL